jgi:hypothetical protein
MTATFTAVPLGDGEEELKMREAARFLQCSGTPIAKAMAAGLIPDLKLSTVARVATIPVLTSAKMPNGQPIPVLRVGPATRDVEDGIRDYYGYRVDFDAHEMLAGCDRWWTPQGSGLILAARAMIVACGTFCVGLAAVGGNFKTVDEESGRVWYDATLVGYLSGPGREVRVVDVESPLAELARKVLGLRVLGGQGGVVTSL